VGATVTEHIPGLKAEQAEVVSLNLAFLTLAPSRSLSLTPFLSLTKLNQYQESMAMAARIVRDVIRILRVFYLLTWLNR